MRTATLWLLPILVAVAVLFGAATTFAQSVTTDKIDYLPGETVTISGEGWQPGEGLLLTIGDSSGTRERVQISATANAEGKFVDRSFILQETDRGRMLTLTVQGELGGVAFMAFRDATGPGALRCSTLAPFDGSHYALAPSQTVVCTIEGATDLSPAQQAGTAPVEVVVKSDTLGTQLATVLSVSGTTITFQYTAPASACGRATVGYGPLKVCDPGCGNCTTYPASGNEANSRIISGTNNPAGFVFVTNGHELTCAAPLLKMEKEPVNGSFSQGSQVFFKLYVSNPAPVGSATAENVIVTDQLPSNGGLVWDNAWSTQGTCNAIVNNKLICNIGSIPPQGTVVITISSTATTPDTACQYQPNPQAIATGNGGLITYASGSLTCTPLPQLKVVKTPDNGTFTVGSTISYTIVVSNPAPAGANSATNVVLTDTLPIGGGLTWATATTSAGICTLTQNALSCQLGEIQAGHAVTVVVTSNTVPASACMDQPNPHAVATADGCLSAEDSGSVSCTTTHITANCVSITAVQGVPITPVTLIATGGVPPYTFTATGLPAGLSISANGTISGTPTVSGTFNYTVTITDFAHNTGTVNCSVTVQPPPVVVNCVTITAVQGVAITPVTLTATGGVPPYTFTATGLPAGLSISTNGTISGTPTVSGTFNYTVTVTDFAHHTGTANCTVVVTPPAPCIIPAVTISNTSWNRFPVPAGTSPVVWVHAHIGTPKNVPTNTVSTVLFTGVQIIINGTPYTLPNGLITFNPAAPANPTTVYNAALNRWETTVNPRFLSNEIFFTGAAIPVTPQIAAGGKATFTYSVQSSIPNLSFPWQWSAAVYTFWPTNWNQAMILAYHSSLHAGTPLNTTVQKSLIQGPRGGGGSNFTGSWSATGNGVCPPSSGGIVIAPPQ